jgi:hypothetical protein
MVQEQPSTTFEKRMGNDNRKQQSGEQSPPLQLPKPQQPSLGQRWSETRLTKTATFWYWLASLVLVLILGFSWGGWMTSSSAEKMATTLANTAVVQRLAPICVAQFQQDPAKDQKLTELKTLSSYQQSDYVTKQGWATMLGEAKPDSKVAAACTKLLLQIN